MFIFVQLSFLEGATTFSIKTLSILDLNEVNPEWHIFFNVMLGVVVLSVEEPPGMVSPII